MSNIRFSLTNPIDYREVVKREWKPSEAAILMYLQLRINQGGGPASAEDIKTALQFSDRTIEAALRRLRAENEVEKRTIYLPLKQAK